MSTLSPFVWRVKFYAPDPKKPKSKEKIKDDIIDRFEYDETGSINFEHAEEESIKNDVLCHASYADERKGSLGLHDEYGRVDMQALEEEVMQGDRMYWRLIISLREDEAIRINHDKPEDWYDTMKLCLPELADSMGLKAGNLEWAIIPEGEDDNLSPNLRWTSAFHPAPGHLHAHVILWEHIPTRTKGELSPGEFRDGKKIFVRQIYRHERERLLIEKSYLRDNIIKLTREEIKRLRADLDRESLAVKAELGTTPTVPPHLNYYQEEEFTKRLYALCGL